MVNTRPINASHSISEVVFVLQFAQDLSDSTISQLTALEEKLKPELPKMEVMKAIGFEIKDDQVIAPSGPQEKLAGVRFSKYSEAAELLWTIRAERNFISVNCLDYERWMPVWERAYSYLAIVAPKLISPENPLTSIALQYVDKFVYEGEKDDYSYTDLFEAESGYLSRNVVNAGPFWHSHQGWFDNYTDTSRTLNRLNINVARADKDHLTTIDHQLVTQFIEPISNPSILFDSQAGQSAMVEGVFTTMHEANKNVLRGLLNAVILKKISLA